MKNGVRSPDRQRTKMEVEEDEANEVDTDANKRTLSKLSSSQVKCGIGFGGLSSSWTWGNVE